MLTGIAAGPSPTGAFGGGMSMSAPFLRPPLAVSVSFVSMGVLAVGLGALVSSVMRAVYCGNTRSWWTRQLPLQHLAGGRSRTAWLSWLADHGDREVTPAQAVAGFPEALVPWSWYGMVVTR